MLVSASELVATAPFQSLWRKGCFEDAIDFILKWVSQTGQREISEGTWDESHLGICKGRAVRRSPVRWSFLISSQSWLSCCLTVPCWSSRCQAKTAGAAGCRSSPTAPVAETAHWHSSQAYAGLLEGVGNETFTFWGVISVPCSELCSSAWITNHMLS